MNAVLEAGRIWFVRLTGATRAMARCALVGFHACRRVSAG